jgi:ABC-type sugar transport system substrate-binding protein
MSKIIPKVFDRVISQRYFHKKGKVLFISQPLFLDENEVDTLDYFCQMLASIAIHLNEVDDYDLVVKIPKSISGWEEQMDFLKECIDNPKEYEIVIISPYDRFRIADHIIRLQQRNRKLKIFTIDKGYSNKEFPKFEENRVDPPMYVKADWSEGGRMAADEFKSFIENNYKSEIASNCQILVLHGNDCHEREQSFLDAIDKYSCDDCDFNASTPKLNGKFLRNISNVKVKVWIKKNKTNLKNKPLLGVFACNDEMALGARQAIIDLEDEYFQEYTPRIIGFDGIRDVTLRIGEKDKFLYGTINIKVHKQVKELIALIKRSFEMIEIEQPEDIECELLKQ